MFLNLTNKQWHASTRLFQIIIEIIKLLDDPDVDVNYWKLNKANERIYKLYKKDRLTYNEICRSEAMKHPTIVDDDDIYGI